MSTKRWTEARIQQLIAGQVEESLNLDYKEAGSLQHTDGKKKEITKDVSAMANSDGGTIIYGVPEDPNTPHYPAPVAPVSRAAFGKESLDQIISTIRPKVEGVVIHPVPIGTNPDAVVYVVEIPKSDTAHQARDLRYYKRHNFESVPMEDYEIRDVMGRVKHPVVEAAFFFSRTPAFVGPQGRVPESLTLWVHANNIGRVRAEYYYCAIDIPYSVLLSPSEGLSTYNDSEGVQYVTFATENVESSTQGFRVLLRGLSVRLKGIPLTTVRVGVQRFREAKIKWLVQVDDASERRGEVLLSDVPGCPMPPIEPPQTQAAIDADNEE